MCKAILKGYNHRHGSFEKFVFKENNFHHDYNDRFIALGFKGDADTGPLAPPETPGTSPRRR